MYSILIINAAAPDDDADDDDDRAPPLVEVFHKYRRICWFEKLC